jgi:aspartate racemase
MVTDVGATHPRVLGVLGGMGPLATADFFAKLTKLSSVSRDQDHLAMVIVSYPEIPDRADALLNGGASPVPAMLAAIRALERAGVDRLVMPCNTAHAWFDVLARATDKPILHIADAVLHLLETQGIAPPAVIGVLGTDATIASQLYQHRLTGRGFVTVVPDAKDQKTVMSAIRAVKAGELARNEQLERVVASLTESGCDRIIAACTELPLILQVERFPRLLDATEALASECLAAFGIAARKNCWETPQREMR